MKICILSFYYPPDLCAGSFRAEALVNALSKNDKVDFIEILTSTPNRYSSHKIDSKNIILSNGKIKIKRIFVPKHNSGITGQTIAFIFFAVGVFNYTKNNQWDIVVATSSRLMTAFLGALISKSKKTPLYLDVRDLFIDTMENIWSKNYLKYLLIIFKYIEKFTFKSADKINIVSKGFNKYLENIVNTKKFSNYTNGIDEMFLNKSFEKNITSKNINILYAGNIGSGQALDLIIPRAALKLKSKARFIIIGDGGKKNKLIKELEVNKVKNVELIKPMDREKLFKYYKKADILFLHLDSLLAFEKVLPSKIFEYGAIGKPIIAGVSGYCANFVKSELIGAEVFEPCNVSDFIKKFNKIIINKKNVKHSLFLKRYNRVEVMKLMANDILKTYYNA